MPLAFGALLGGTCTLIGTSTNLAVSGALAKLGRGGELASQFGVSPDLLGPFSMFELTPVGIAIVVVGMLYMLAIGLRLLPSRGLGAESLVDQYQMREYISEVIVLEDSPLVGKTLAEGNLSEMLDLTVIGILRGKQNRLPPRGEEVLRAGDLLLVQGRMEDILRVKEEAGIEIRPDFELRPGDISGSGGDLYEVMVLRGSDLTNRTLRSLNFRDRYDLTVLAINRHGMALLTKLSTVTLRFGDVLLVQGEKSCVERLTADGHVLMLEGELGGRRERADKRIWAALAFVVFLSFSVMHLPQVPLAVAVLFGVLILLASRAVILQEVYDLIDWRLIVLIAGMISFGTAMEKTHADQYLADIIVRNFSSYGGLAVLAGFFALTVALTQPMSNQAAALVVLPIAVKTALALGLNPRTFAVAVTYAASCSFLTPLEPACVLIYTPGRYRFLDFVKVGSILTIAVFAIVMLLVPYFWPLAAK
jgi:di/tricarboxylate transporter